jgi:hypothetical protein
VSSHRLSAITLVLFAAGPLACGGESTRSDDEASDSETGEGETAETGDEGSNAQFGEEREFTLRITDDAPPPLVLEMGREEVAELFGDVASEIKLLELDSTPLLTNTLEAIKHACGDDWQNNTADPVFDCDQTALGQTFVGDSGSWEDSAEFSMVRILTMTPANSKVEGTSLQGVQGLSDFLALFTGGFAGMMGESLEIPVTAEFLDTGSVVASMRTNLLGTHPEVLPGGKLALYLSDALADLETLGTRLGPNGEHPGVLTPDFPVHGEVFGPDFQMNVAAESNLRVLDGLDLSVDKGFITVVADVTGPNFDDEAEFDFEDPTKFTMTGLNPNPSIDLRFAIFEHPEFIPACTSDVSAACVDNEPGFPIANDLVWTLDPWQLEYLIAYAGTLKYATLQTVVTQFLTDIVKVGQDGNPAGWAEFNVPLGFLFGEPPAQFVWELINEVAQYDLHYLEDPETPTFAEGDANVEFTLFDVPCGLTGAEAAEAVRPYLQGQASNIAGYLLGNYKENNFPVDFYYRRADNGAPHLFFVTPEDLLEGQGYGWASPGFFGDPDLQDKLSRTELPGIGETGHEKLAITAGETIVYAADDEGTTYRLRIVAPEGDPTAITIYAAARVD